MSTVAADNTTVAGAVQLYVEGVAKGDTAKLERAFHQDARMYGLVGGQRFDIPISEMIAMSASQPADTEGSYRATIRDVEEEGDAEQIDGEGKIVNKTFAHTGGEMPASEEQGSDPAGV